MHGRRDSGSCAGRPADDRPTAAGVRAYVLDADLRPADEGELFLAGPGVARGYTGSPGATARAFLPDPHTGHGERMYRTGDKV